MTEVMISLPTSLLIFLATKLMVMQDVKEFQERFNRYKNGESVSEIYNIPRYDDGKSTKGKFTRQQEETLSSIYNTFKALGYDDNSIFGILGNALTESSLDPDSVSDSKSYHGLLQNSTAIKKAILNKYGDYSLKNQMRYVHAWVSGDDWVKKNPDLTTYNGRYRMSGYKSASDAADAFTRFYERPVILNDSGKVIGYQKAKERMQNAELVAQYFANKNGIKTATLPDGNKKITIDPSMYQVPEYKSTWQPAQPIKTEYPLGGSQAPESLSSWNAAQSPSATPTIPSIQKVNNERNSAVQGAFQLPGVTVFGNKRASLLPKMPSLNDAFMAYSPQNQMNRAVSESLGLDDLWEDVDVTSDLFRFKNGKLPRYGVGKDGYRYVKNDETGGWDRITDDDEADTMSNVVVTPYGVRNKFYYESNPNYIAPRQKGEVVKQDNNLWTRQQVEKANNTRTWRSDVADALHSIGEGAMMAANFVPFEGELAQGANWLYNTAKSYIRHPFYKTVYHGSPYPFDVNNAWTATYHDLGLHVGSKETATEMAGKDGVIYKLRIPKENTETIDIGANGSKQLYNSYFMPARSRQYPNDFYDTTPGDDLRIKLLQDAGAEPYIDGNRLYTENAVMIPLRRTAYPDIPEKYMRDVHEITRQTLMNEAPLSRFRVHDPILQKKLNQQANDILSNSGYKVIKYHNANPYEGGGTAYMITDPSVIDVMEDLPEFKRLILPSGIDASYVYSQYKDGKSPIHIKPQNRGKLTRLKKRTGKSESELYNDGNPAHKKMVVFARNARKWKH